MSGLHVLDGKAFLDKDFEAVELPARWMSGSCGGLLHKDPDVKAFRKAVTIYCGDFELSVFCLERKDARDVSFERFIASHLRRMLHLGGTAVPEDAPRRFHFRDKRHAQELARMPEAEQAASYVKSLPHHAPVDVLWDFANFGGLMWDWQRRSLEQLGPGSGLERGVYASAEDGSKFIPRIFVDVPPDLAEADTDEVRKSALEGLEALPKLRNGLSRSAMSKLITGDVRALAALCRKHGTFGAAVLPGAFDSITGFCLKAQTGNEYEAFVETGEQFYFFSLFTS